MSKSAPDRKNLSLPTNIVNRVTELAKEKGIKQYQLAGAALLLVMNDSKLLDQALELHISIGISPSLSKKVRSLTEAQQLKLNEMIESGEL